MYPARKKKLIRTKRNTLSPKGFVISGIYTQKELHAIVSYERARSDRENTSFAIIHIHLDLIFLNNRNRVVGFLNNLRRIIRDIDHLGWWDNETFAVLLPSTDYKGAKVCSEKLRNRLFALGYDFDLSIYSYPSHWLQNNGKNGENFYNREEKKACLHFEKVFTTKMPGWKRCIDILGAVTALFLFTPVLLFTTLFIKIVSPGPVIFTQKRVGYRGVEFDFYKFRSMHEGNNQAFHGKHAVDFITKAEIPMLKLDSADPRIIPGGKILRKFCIDELPQLVNVLMGNMSLVGPRPCIPYEKESYLRWHTHRFDIVPGMTGLWQVSGKNKLTFKQMIRLDIAYCRNLSPVLDIKIILMTIPAILKMVIESVNRKFSHADTDPDTVTGTEEKHLSRESRTLHVNA